MFIQQCSTVSPFDRGFKNRQTSEEFRTWWRNFESESRCPVANFNGDDALVLRNGTAVVDSFGQVGVDPGSQWPGGGQNDTLRRSPAVCTGDSNFTDAFDASVEWDVLGIDILDGLGSHVVTCE